MMDLVRQRLFNSGDFSLRLKYNPETGTESRLFRHGKVLGLLDWQHPNVVKMIRERCAKLRTLNKGKVGGTVHAGSIPITLYMAGYRMWDAFVRPKGETWKQFKTRMLNGEVNSTFKNADWSEFRTVPQKLKLYGIEKDQRLTGEELVPHLNTPESIRVRYAMTGVPFMPLVWLEGSTYTEEDKAANGYFASTTTHDSITSSIAA